MLKSYTARPEGLVRRMPFLVPLFMAFTWPHGTLQRQVQAKLRHIGPWMMSPCRRRHVFRSRYRHDRACLWRPGHRPMPSLAFCGNLVPIASTSVGRPARIEISCYVCTYNAVVEGAIPGEVDFHKRKIEGRCDGRAGQDDAAARAKQSLAPKVKA